MCMYVKVYKVLLERLVDRPWGRCLTWHFRLDAGTVDDPDQIRRRPSSHALQLICRMFRLQGRLPVILETCPFPRWPPPFIYMMLLPSSLVISSRDGG